MHGIWKKFHSSWLIIQGLYCKWDQTSSTSHCRDCFSSHYQTSILDLKRPATEFCCRNSLTCVRLDDHKCLRLKFLESNGKNHWANFLKPVIMMMLIDTNTIIPLLQGSFGQHYAQETWHWSWAAHCLLNKGSKDKGIGIKYIWQMLTAQTT